MAALSASAVQAGSQASASLSGLTFTLIDLNPNDGVEASFSFTNAAGSTSFVLNAVDSAQGAVEGVTSTRSGTFSFSRDEWVSLTNANAHGVIGDQTLAVSGVANGPSTSFNASVSTGSPTSYYYGGPVNLSLSANTLLLIDSQYDLKASANNPSGCSYYYCQTTESATATVSSSLSYNYSGGSISASYNGTETRSLQAIAAGSYTSYTYVYDPVLGYSVPVYTTVPGTEQFREESGVLRSVFSNSSGLTQSASFYLSASVTGSATTPVPEPASYALMLQGLLLGGWAVARQRRAKRTTAGV
ncbi:MAG: PEP-CTERM sorting domain-containing protein [Pseudomonadota bacterium]